MNTASGPVGLNPPVIPKPRIWEDSFYPSLWMEFSEIARDTIFAKMILKQTSGKLRRNRNNLWVSFLHNSKTEFQWGNKTYALLKLIYVCRPIYFMDNFYWGKYALYLVSFAVYESNSVYQFPCCLELVYLPSFLPSTKMFLYQFFLTGNWLDWEQNLLTLIISGKQIDCKTVLLLFLGIGSWLDFWNLKVEIIRDYILSLYLDFILTKLLFYFVFTINGYHVLGCAGKFWE